MLSAFPRVWRPDGVQRSMKTCEPCPFNGIAQHGYGTSGDRRHNRQSCKAICRKSNGGIRANARAHREPDLLRRAHVCVALLRSYGPRFLVRRASGRMRVDSVALAILIYGTICCSDNISTAHGFRLCAKSIVFIIILVRCARFVFFGLSGVLRASALLSVRVYLGLNETGQQQRSIAVRN